jgi:hypothetical protein
LKHKNFGSKYLWNHRSQSLYIYNQKPNLLSYYFLVKLKFKWITWKHAAIGNYQVKQICYIYICDLLILVIYLAGIIRSGQPSWRLQCMPFGKFLLITMLTFEELIQHFWSDIYLLLMIDFFHIHSVDYTYVTLQQLNPSND